MSTPRKTTRVCIRLTQRQKNDNPELLEQVREALRQKNITLVVNPALEDTCSQRNEYLEDKAVKLAGAILDQWGIVNGNVEPEAKTEPKPEPKPEDKQAEAETRIKRLRKWMGKLAATGWKVVVEVLLDKVLPPGRGA